MSTPRLQIFTLALNAMLYITRHLPVFQRLEIPWRWVIVHGIADPVADTAWCQRLPDHFKHDDTLAQISALSGLDSRIHIVSADRWAGKTAMCNAALAQFDKPGTLMQIDADEIWRTDQLETIPRLLDAYPQCDCASFGAVTSSARGASSRSPMPTATMWANGCALGAGSRGASFSRTNDPKVSVIERSLSASGGGVPSRPLRFLN